MQPYNETYFQQEWVEKTQFTLERYLKLLPGSLSKTSKFLDIGCGSGRFVDLLKRKGFEKTFGIDISIDAINSGKRLNNDSSLIVGSADCGLPFQSQTFDVVFFLDVIEHLQRPYEALLEIRRIVKNDGILFITTPNAGSLLRRLQGSRWYALKDKTHLFYFDSFNLLYLLNKLGFSVEKKFTYSGFDIPGLNYILEKSQQGGQLVVLVRRKEDN